MGLDAKQFLSKLQTDLASGKIEIAGFPDSVLLLLREMRDEFVSNARLERIVRTDAALAERIVSMANSAAFQSSSGPSIEVGNAIARIGLAALRTVVLAYGFARLRDQKIYKVVQGRMGDIWSHGLAVATLARAIHTLSSKSSLNRDALILGGMLSGVGKIYLLAELAHHQDVLEDFGAVEHLLETWHTKAAWILLKEWDFPEAVARAAISIAKPHGASAEDPVADMLFVADMLASMRGKSEEVAKRLQVSAPAMRLGLAGVDAEKIYAAAATEAASISKALG